MESPVKLLKRQTSNHSIGKTRMRRTNSSAHNHQDPTRGADEHGSSSLLPVLSPSAGEATSKGKVFRKKRGSLRRRKGESMWIFQVRTCLRFIRRNDRYIPFGVTCLLTIVSVTAFLSAIFWPSPGNNPTTMFSDKRQQQTIHVKSDFSVVLASRVQSLSRSIPKPANTLESSSGHPNFAGLKMTTLEPGESREIQPNDPLLELGYQELKFNKNGKTDDVESLYAFDDDFKRNPYNDYEDDNIQNEKQCRRTNWYRDLPINCNNVRLASCVSFLLWRLLGSSFLSHSFYLFLWSPIIRSFMNLMFSIGFSAVIQDTLGTFFCSLSFVVTVSLCRRYISTRFTLTTNREGAFREVYLSKLPRETLIFKAYVWDSDFLAEDFEWMRFDAIVAEKLSAYQAIVAIYGFCGTAMINEAMENGDIENMASPLGHRYTYKIKESEKDFLVVKNKLEGTQKLQFGLEMAEAVAVMHGYPGGVIVHNE